MQPTPLEDWLDALALVVFLAVAYWALPIVSALIH